MSLTSVKGMMSTNIKTIGNNYSTNTIATDLKMSDKVCAYVATTRRVLCGSIIEDYNGYVTTNIQSSAGDSGGPLWAPGKGFIGTLSGTFPNGATAYTKINPQQQEVIDDSVYQDESFWEYIKNSIKNVF